MRYNLAKHAALSSTASRVAQTVRKSGIYYVVFSSAATAHLLHIFDTSIDFLLRFWQVYMSSFLSEIFRKKF